MSHKFNGDFSMLESDERKKIFPVNNILNTLKIQEGNTIIDFGCGIGYFSLPLTKLVGESGKVIAIDESSEMIDELKKRASGLNNLEIVKSNKIRPYKGDIILLVNILHEVDDPKNFLIECFNSLNPNGRIIIIDWQKKETKFGPPVSHRISIEEVKAFTNKEFIEHEIDKSSYFLELKL